ncbi:MAG TPA: sigma 54-interacting transcriptional regulator [Candidatus Angelobacter sp.]|nr:sigma 54-interacting transcriptional regulator [Candidatus Angelobacter sp.]
MGARLIAVAGPLLKMEFPLDDEATVIGRDVAATVCVKSRSASRRHCAVRREGDQYLIRDLGSSNGTLVNGLPVTECVLQHGDRIAVSDSLFVFAVDLQPERALRPEVTESGDATPIEFSSVHEAELLFRDPHRLLSSMSRRHGIQLRALLEINRKAATLRNPEELEQALLEAAFELTPAESGAVLLYEQLDAPASTVVGQHRSSELTEVRVSQTVVRRVLTQRVAVLARDTGAEETLKDVASLAGGHQSILCVPLLAQHPGSPTRAGFARGGVEERTLGVLYLSSRNAGQMFDDIHLETMTGVAAVIGLSLVNAFDFQRMRAQAHMLEVALDHERPMIGESAATKKLCDSIARAATADATVLLLGESGTGKEVAARTLHRNSRRAEKAFMAVNCATLGDNLLESELFGHEKGAFTGAVGLKKGLLETADGGTVFLDEVAELPVTVQAKMLRVLQEREFSRLGSTRPIKVNVRLIAATNKDLRAAVADGSFREDLWHRLNVVTLRLPPLRERREDIPLLANFFLARSSQRCERRVLGISAEARESLQLYDWPGNVRELENAIERAVVLGTDSEIQMNDLPETIWEGAPAVPGSLTYHAALREAKEKIVTQALELTGGNITEAARRLGVHVTYLHRLMRTFKMKSAAADKHS